MDILVDESVIVAVAGEVNDTREQPWKRYLALEKAEGKVERATWQPGQQKPWEKPWIGWQSAVAANNPNTQGT
ncbi:uncharacterized protein N7458_001297 [Penicillium daleae]|uniref:Uncharacterized protein n=1 Tax=Penicillium daleae TaxID=63821 RepID=A0AAD6G5N2_9EURO|nr:uncharacterized protein N7458_001297 [Penicillium daleae]KAJ5459745.1 hypothetical protein N7458_001297 [Penicillium daleae]